MITLRGLMVPTSSPATKFEAPTPSPDGSLLSVNVDKGAVTVIARNLRPAFSTRQFQMLF